MQNKNDENNDRKYKFLIKVLLPILASISKSARLFLDANWIESLILLNVWLNVFLKLSLSISSNCSNIFSFDYVLFKDDSEFLGYFSSYDRPDL